MTQDEQVAFDHAWRHFALHADQRMSVFNFYIASASLLATGEAYVLVAEAKSWQLGIVAGVMLAVLTFVFWKLDQRSAEIIKVAEKVMESIEAAELQSARRTLSIVANLPTNYALWRLSKPWTFGRAFRGLFLAVGLVGLAGAGLSAQRGLNSAASKSKSSLNKLPTKPRGLVSSQIVSHKERVGEK